MKTSLGIWALGPMVTRFVPGGHHPEHGSETTVQKVQRAVRGHDGLIDSYEFHYPAELSEENLDEVRAALGNCEIYCVCSGLHLDPRFERGGMTSPDPGLRREAVEITLRAADFAARVRAHLICWPGIEGYNYPFQTPYRHAWGWLLDGLGCALIVGLSSRPPVGQLAAQDTSR